MHLDTHVALWLYAREFRRIPAAARSRLDSQELRFSPMALLELAYLHEIDRIVDDADTVMGDLSSRFELAVASTPFALVSAAARTMAWTRDPFDRIIAAQATVDSATLLTADPTILGNVTSAWWP
ncbi:MAG: type II toxin-antitoxin system VapC family toxin [Egibacteraceae bacterium]